MKKFFVITTLLMVVMLSSCNNENPYEESDMVMLAQLEEEKKILFGNYAEGDSLTFVGGLGDTTWFVITEMNSGYSRGGRKESVLSTKSSYISSANCELTLCTKGVAVTLQTGIMPHFQLDTNERAIYDRHGNYIYNNEKPDIYRSIEILLSPTPDIANSIENNPPTTIQDDELLFVSSHTQKDILLTSWALVRKEHGILKIADAYGNRWTAVE